MEISVSISENIIRLLKEKNIDAAEAVEILDQFNNGEIGNEEQVQVTGIPGEESIVNTTGSHFSFTKDEIEAFEDNFGFSVPEKQSEGLTRLSLEKITQLGNDLLPFIAYGVLNGGSATSYADTKKNKSFNPEYFQSNEALFSSLAESVSGKPKGITPAFINPDGSAGPSFMELKLRAVLIQMARYKKKTGDGYANPLFQMTSVTNDDEIKEALSSYAKSPFLEDLSLFSDIDVESIKTASQPLIAAYTQDPRGARQIFLGKDGKSPLPLPGGHGQNFKVLKSVYRELENEGKLYAQLGNIDNLGNIPDPVSIAVTAIKRPQSAFEFSFKTKVDVKGGILVRDQHAHFNCADIGVAISKEDVQTAEDSGKPILFNCATGIFNLNYLNGSIDRIIRRLPVRFSNQDKDAGMYSQAEQVTWEIIGLLDDILILGVDKYKRFIAAKLLLESFLASGIGIDALQNNDPAFFEVGLKLNRGLSRLLEQVYCLYLEGGKWLPIPLSHIN